MKYPGCQRSSRSPAARNVRVSSADRRLAIAALPLNFVAPNEKKTSGTRVSVKFLKGFEKIQKISRELNFQLLKAAKVRKSFFNSSISIGLSDLQ